MPCRTSRLPALLDGAGGRCVCDFVGRKSADGSRAERPASRACAPRTGPPPARPSTTRARLIQEQLDGAADGAVPGKAPLARPRSTSRCRGGPCGAAPATRDDRHRRDRGHLPRDRVHHRARAGGGIGMVQLHRAQLPARAPRARHARHAVSRGRWPAAHAYVTRADPHAPALPAAHPRARPGQRLSARLSSTRRMRQCSRRSRASRSTKA